MYKFKINNININSLNGNAVIEPNNINVIVGPNNSGKSRLLKEIINYLAGDLNDLKKVLICTVVLIIPLITSLF